MSPKIKIFVGFLAIIAMVSFYSLLDFSRILIKGPLVANLNAASKVSAPDSDPDHDGLSNTEESYWGTDFRNPDTDGDGFPDGEEVASGHDPLIPGPDDLLPKEGNLTAKFTDLTLSGIYDGTLRSDNPDYMASMDKVALAIIDDGYKSFNKKINVSDLKSAPSDKASQEKYFVDLGQQIKILFNEYSSDLNELSAHLETVGKNGFSDQEFVSYYTNKTEIFSAVLTALTSMAVPEPWQQLHLNLIVLVNEIAEINHSIAGGSQDPIKATVALNRLVDTMDEFKQVISDYSAKIKADGLPDILFK